MNSRMMERRMQRKLHVRCRAGDKADIILKPYLSLLILVTATIHKLIHATNFEIIQNYLQTCKPDMKKLNVLRKLVGNNILSVD